MLWVKNDHHEPAFTSGGMKISRKAAKLAKALFFTLRLCAFA